jgi:hypothetical protein
MSGLSSAQPNPETHGVYAPLDSLEFLTADLAENVGQSGRPVVITHHVDVARYCVPMNDPARAAKNEWDFADVAAYHDALKGYHIAGIFYGHTHVRRVFPWDGHPPAKGAAVPAPLPGGVPVFNTAKASHFNSPAQGFFHFQITETDLVAREFATKDGWRTAAWTPEIWQFPLSHLSSFAVAGLLMCGRSLGSAPHVRNRSRSQRYPHHHRRRHTGQFR